MSYIPKEAQRKRTHHSQDIKNESLRSNKDKWNEEVSSWIARLKPLLISTKRGLNGRGDPQAGIPASNLKDPLPPEVPAHLSEVAQHFQELASEFQRIMGEASGLVQEQASYSQNRRKPAVRHASYETSDKIIADASWVGSRAWSGVKNMFSTSPNKVFRVALLKQATDIYYFIIKIEELLLDRGTSNITELNKANKALQSKLEDMSKSFQTLRRETERAAISKEEDSPKSPLEAVMPTTPDPTIVPEPEAAPDPIAVPVVDATPVPEKTTNRNTVFKGMVSNINEIKKSKLMAIDSLREFYDIAKQYVEANQKKQYALQLSIFTALEEEYDGLIPKFRKVLEEKKGYPIKDNADMDELLAMTKKASIDKQANPVGDLGRSFKRMFRQFAPGDKTTGERIAAYQHAHKMRKVINEIMDLLEETDVDITMDAKDENLLFGKIEKCQDIYDEMSVNVNNLYNQVYTQDLSTDQDEIYDKRRDMRRQRKLITKEIGPGR